MGQNFSLFSGWSICYSFRKKRTNFRSRYPQYLLHLAIHWATPLGRCLLQDIGFGPVSNFHKKNGRSNEGTGQYLAFVLYILRMYTWNQWMSSILAAWTHSKIRSKLSNQNKGLLRGPAYPHICIHMLYTLHSWKCKYPKATINSFFRRIMFPGVQNESTLKLTASSPLKKWLLGRWFVSFLGLNFSLFSGWSICYSFRKKRTNLRSRYPQYLLHLAIHWATPLGRCLLQDIGFGPVSNFHKKNGRSNEGTGQYLAFVLYILRMYTWNQWMSSILAAWTHSKIRSKLSNQNKGLLRGPSYPHICIHTLAGWKLCFLSITRCNTLSP